MWKKAFILICAILVAALFVFTGCEKSDVTDPGIELPQAPEVDNEVLIPADRDLQTGEFYRVKITGAEEFDLYGRVE